VMFLGQDLQTRDYVERSQPSARSGARMRRVPDFLPVGLQNFLHRRQSDLHE